MTLACAAFLTRRLGLGASRDDGRYERTDVPDFHKISKMLATSVLSFGIALTCLFVLVSASVGRLALDRPNERSLHEIPVPRTGGLAIILAVAVSLAIADSREQVPLLIILALAAVSFGDDLFNLPTTLRFGVHVAAAAGFLALVVPSASPIKFLLLLLGVVWFTNLFNFMDGCDGLAGGMAVVGFGACAIAAYSQGVTGVAAVCIATASAALAFLTFNFPPARIFMGDVGSIPLGFLAGGVGVVGWEAGAWPIWFPILVFSPFAVDATFTLCKRLLRGDKVWTAHREHYYQRLVLMGLGHRNTALAEYLLMAVCAGVALAVRDAQLSVQGASLAALGGAYVILAVWIDGRWARYRLANQQRQS